MTTMTTMTNDVSSRKCPKGKLAVVIFLKILTAALPLVSATALADARDNALMGALMRMELAGRVVAEAKKMSDLPDVASAADLVHEQMFARARNLLVDAFGNEDDAQTAFADFVDAVRANPAGYAALRAEVAKDGIGGEISEAGKFLGNVQSWLRLRENGDVPPLQAWLARDDVADEKSKVEKSNVESAKPKKKKKRKSGNPLRDAEADPGEFIEQEGEVSALDSFNAARDARRQKALQDAESGMAQVAEERRAADEEYNAKKQARAEAEAAALQAQAQKLAAADQEAVQQDLNSWKSRLKGIASSAISATGGAVLGTVGTRIGQEAANAVFNNKKPAP